MTFWTIPYQIQFEDFVTGKIKQQVHRGCLLRWGHSSEGFSYSDLRPLTEFGDEPLEMHLHSLKVGKETDLVRRALQLGQWERQAREQGRSLVGAQELVHCYTPGWGVQPKQDIEGAVKLKAMNGLSELGNKMAQFRDFGASHFILDFNESFEFNEVLRWLDSLDANLIEGIRYLEDPCGYDAKQWSELNQRVPIALDFAADGTNEFDGYSVLVIKPSRQNVELLLEAHLLRATQFSVTHSLQSDVGRLFDLAWACEIQSRCGTRLVECGLRMPESAQCFPHLGLLEQAGNQIRSARHPGLGFSITLHDLNWQSL